MALVLRYWQATAIVALLVAAGGLFRARDRALEARGVALERVRIADSTLAAVRPQLARVDTLVVRDTVRVRREITRLDTLRETVLQRLTDTLRVIEYVQQTDSVVQACSALSRDCAAFRTYATMTIAALEAKVAAPALRSCAASNVASGAIGALFGALGVVTLR